MGCDFGMARGHRGSAKLAAVAALAKITSGTSENKNVVIDCGEVPICVNLLASPSDDVCTETRPAVTALGRLIHCRKTLSENQVLTYACQALTGLCWENAVGKQAVVDAGLCQHLVELLLHPSPDVILKVLGTLRNITAGVNAQAQANSSRSPPTGEQ